MDDSAEYIEGKPTVIKSNKGRTYLFISFYAKKESEELWEDVYKALLRMGIFDNIQRKFK